MLLVRASEECYHILFRKKLYNTLDELQADIDTWLTNYNNERSHSGKHGFGKTPIDFFRNSLMLRDLKETRNLDPQRTLMYVRIRVPHRRTNHQQK
ncbi:IS3 family transposase [Candidatus Tisiphia endosymbiont of Myopa tessellatipennis]|uniref:IS3 family transposase n=1 Tax=Candidatus Tisiphia endosymbiont of Myopa tessellatipennis TaxID=3066257 RepID=UPI0039773D7A